jgi:hypothetical protein
MELHLLLPACLPAGRRVSCPEVLIRRPFPGGGIRLLARGDHRQQLYSTQWDGMNRVIRDDALATRSNTGMTGVTMIQTETDVGKSALSLTDFDPVHL